MNPKSFWDEAALRAQGESVRAAWGVEAPHDKKPLRGDPPPAPAPLLPSEEQLSLRLAEELDYARRLLDSMGDELASDPTVVARYTAALQSVDIVGQMIGHIATVIRCNDPAAAVDRIGMAELKARLQRRSAL